MARQRRGAWLRRSLHAAERPQVLRRRAYAHPPDVLLGRARIVPNLFAKALRRNPNDSLQAIRHLRWRLELLELEAVALARSYGWSWQAIGDSLGLRRQTVHRRYANQIGTPRPRRRYPRDEP